MNETTINAESIGLQQYLKQIYKHRHLIVTFFKRDIKVKYAQTLIGIAWVIAQPLTGLLIFTFFFDKLIQVDTGNVPYPLFAFSGMVAWYFFSFIFNEGAMSLVNSIDLVKKMYFPKLILPISKILVGFVEFGLSMLLLFLMMLYLQPNIGIQIVWFPFFVLLNILVGLSVAIPLSALTARYRDLYHIIPYLINFGIWLTPVFYPATLIPQQWAFLLYANPMAAVIEGYRWTLLGGTTFDPYYLFSFVPVFVLLYIGIVIFVNIEGKLADIL